MTEAVLPAGGAAAPYARRWWTLGVLCLSLMIVTMGNSVLNVAIPTLSRELHATTSQLQWSIAAYSLVFAGLLFTAGAIGDRFGRKGALQLGLIGFLFGTLLASLSTEMWHIIACRAFMGACAAFIMPSTLSILVNVFPAHERTKAIAIWAGVSGAAGMVGPLLSGWMLGHFWYGSVFLVTIPFIFVALILGFFYVPTSRDPEQAQLDLVGAGLSIVGISSLVYALIQAPDDGWTGPQPIVAFVIALVFLTGFVLWELHVDEPMLDMHFFQHRAFSTATGGMILVFLSMFGVMFLITQYFQLILGFSPLGSALRFLPIAPVMLIVAPMTPRIAARIGVNRTVALGMSLVSIGFLLFTTLQVDTSYAHVLVFMLILITGIALTISPMTASIMSVVPPRRAGAGSAMNDATRELGAALGVAVLGSVAASRYSAGIAHAIAPLAPGDRATASASLGAALQTAARLPQNLGGPLVSAAEHAFVSGIHIAAFTGTVLCACAALAVLKLMPRQIVQQGAMHDALSAAEDMAELGLGGTLPVFADTAVPDQVAAEGVASG
ncbi:MAG TPA: DHA2 family efflux MFS transporter permease subunit [Acidimicrobiales bacterium]|nr:DHA2 family efflux MFS transporter permease subunit [Acidimicrobiales bacterium]